MIIVTEYLPKGDLHEYLKRKGALKPATALKFAMDIARGMNYLHENKPEAIIHRDLEPYIVRIVGKDNRNILRDDSGHLNVADFGVSKLLKVANKVKEDRPLTCYDTSCCYVAPEVFRNEEYDTQVDVFSFALILQETYYQRKGTVQGSCDFQNTASVTQTPPTVPTGCSENTSHGTLGASNRTDQEASKPDDKALRCLEQNREAARKTHLRKKAYIQQLQNTKFRILHLEQELDRARQ
ncbi:hypothetical protein OROHE_015952 [Orobanche hederae]